MVKHVVLFRFKPGTSEARIAELYQQVHALVQCVPGLLDCCGGPNCSTEGLNRGLTHGFIMTFRDPTARDGYLVHPDHELVKQALLNAIDDALVVDFDV
jgi:hypothetical protein